MVGAGRGLDHPRVGGKVDGLVVRPIPSRNVAEAKRNCVDALISEGSSFCRDGHQHHWQEGEKSACVVVGGDWVKQYLYLVCRLQVEWVGVAHLRSSPTLPASRAVQSTKEGGTSSLHHEGSWELAVHFVVRCCEYSREGKERKSKRGSM